MILIFISSFNFINYLKTQIKIKVLMLFKFHKIAFFIKFKFFMFCF